MAEIELGTADGSDEIKVDDEVQDYLASRRYPETATKVEKGVIWKRAKTFCLLMASYTTSKVVQFNIYFIPLCKK